MQTAPTSELELFGLFFFIFFRMTEAKESTKI